MLVQLSMDGQLRGVHIILSTVFLAETLSSPLLKLFVMNDYTRA